MRKRTLTAILSMFVVFAGLTGYVIADIHDVVPGFLTNQGPEIARDVPSREFVQVAETFPAHMRLDLPAIEATDMQPLWQRLVDATHGEYQVGAYVIDALTGNVLLNGAGQTPMVPASTMKILAAFTSMQALGSTDRLATSVYLGADGQLHLVGEGDLMLAEGKGDVLAVNGRAGLADLASLTSLELTRIRNTGEAVEPTRLIFHPSIFEGETRESALPDELLRWVGHVSAFAVDRGEFPGPGYQPFRDNPGQHVAQILESALKEHGINIDSEVEPAPFDVGEARLLGQVHSADLGQITRYMLAHSDNTLAEHLCRMAAGAATGRSDLASATAHVVDEITAAGIHHDGLVIHDCSGLNEENHVAPRTTAEVLQAVWNSDNAGVRQLMRDLPIGLFSGTLNDRFSDNPLGPRIQAKTGSLQGVASLAGFATTNSGRVLIFHVQTNDVQDNAFFTRGHLDNFVVELVNR